ncbi:SSI family serine proteinase inhibitor [Streptosporangium amethystogenes subsp. fukuiense]|uniref:SSI family serine proteinase inhibitor n=2 Tax=Streptosporangium amethystogenes TaxID=2002 RepID=A0ABW2TA74_9ACTN
MAALSASPAGADSLGDPRPGISEISGDEFSARALVLTLTQGSTTLPSTRTVVLQCSPVGGGTHPRAREACAALEPASGDVRKFKPATGLICPLIYEPVTVSAVGVWKSRFTMSSQTFGNSCQMRNALGVVGGF